MNTNLPRNGFVYDCNSQTITALQLLKVLLTNPSGSGKKIICDAYSVPNVSNVATMGTLFINPSGGTMPSTAYTPLPYLVDSNWKTPGNVGQFVADVVLATAPWSNANQIITVPIKPSDRNFTEGAPITLLPGMSMGFQFGGLAMVGVTVAVWTREENI